MKKLIFSLLIVVAVMTQSSCAWSESSEASDAMFGKIPVTIKIYDLDSKELNAGLTESNYKKTLAKLEDLKAETIAKLEKQGEALNGKELSVTVDPDQLKIEEPLTWVYKTVFSNVKAVEFNLNGKIAASKDIPLDVNSSDLTFEKDFFGKDKGLMVVKVPVHLEFLDKENKVLDTRTIGFLIADNDGKKAVVKQGAIMDRQGAGSVPVNEKLVDATSARVVLDMSNILKSYPQ